MSNNEMVNLVRDVEAKYLGKGGNRFLSGEEIDELVLVCSEMEQMPRQFIAHAVVYFACALQTLQVYRELLKEYVNAPVVFSNERLSYMGVQISKNLEREARSLLTNG